MGVKVTNATAMYGEHMSSISNCTNPGSTLNEKHMTRVYHFVREHVANGVVSVRNIHTKDNYPDPFTKALVRDEYHGFYHEYMVKG